MQSFDNLDKNIDKYYEGSLDNNSSDESAIKEALDMMSLAKDFEKIVSIPTDVSSIVEKGQQIRLNAKLRKETFKFLPIAILITAFIGLIAIKSSLIVISIVQVILSVLLISLIVLVPRKYKRREHNWANQIW